MSKKNKKIIEEVEVEEVFLEDLSEYRTAPLNEVYLPLHRFSEDGHSWNGKAYVDYVSRAEV